MELKLTKKQQEEIFEETLKMLYNAVTEEDILRVVGNSLYIGNQKLNKETLISLKSGAEAIQMMEVWQLLVKEMKYIANKRMFEQRVSCVDRKAGHSVVFVGGPLPTTLNNLSAL